MTVVLDTSAIVALAVDDMQRSAVVEAALTNELCYMSPVAVAEAYYWLLARAGKQLADHWLAFVVSGRDIQMDPDVDRDLIELVGEARLLGVSPSGAFTAALAHRKGVPVLSAALEYTELERRRFCQVRWI
ncbi:MAG: PIN domain-containing protein [Armatimonadetes bacterium]|nr:PIN domain-containing protein [Armatimonadota bacterium]